MNNTIFSNKFIEKKLDKLSLRIFIGAIFGVPLTAISLVAGIYGLVFGYAGLVGGGVWLIIIGVVTITGLIGICGAWRRLLKTSNLMTKRERKIIRNMLFCGFLSSFVITAWLLYVDGISELSLILIILSLGGVVFILGTPKNAL